MWTLRRLHAHACGRAPACSVHCLGRYVNADGEIQASIERTPRSCRRSSSAVCEYESLAVCDPGDAVAGHISCTNLLDLGLQRPAVFLVWRTDWPYKFVAQVDFSQFSASCP